jgi:hypothetical protein
MKLPAVEMAAAVAGEIAIGAQRSRAAHASSRELVVGFLILVMAGLVAAAILLRTPFTCLCGVPERR